MKTEVRLTRDMCWAHYRRWKRYGDAGEGGVRRWKYLDKVCEAEGCDQPPKSRNLCQLHYQRLRQGVPLDGIVRYSVCQIPGCDRPHHAKGMCRPHRSRFLNLIRDYGITVDVYDARLAAQRGGCAICRSDVAGGRAKFFHVDHDHETGRVRGLLCARCNPGLGYFRDSPELLETAAAYLRMGIVPT